ncbi:hypothetical protein AYI69_g3852 [Smittium culicis]|uniref:Uncharacterized protein n=1 Tax=Smittium culicis TaxID=133412 RepID=A0A1R1YIJ4_9FUNG|nr:hypothetical protein AYI69_g3852 [Smittium culicis]
MKSCAATLYSLIFNPKFLKNSIIDRQNPQIISAQRLDSRSTSPDYQSFTTQYFLLDPHPIDLQLIFTSFKILNTSIYDPQTHDSLSTNVYSKFLIISTLTSMIPKHLAS